MRFCFAQTEPDAGSDPAGMRTRAVRDGDHYVINGTKRFITAAGSADYAQVMAVTDRRRARAAALAASMVDMKAPGVTLERQWPTMMGERRGQIHFENVRVPGGEHASAAKARFFHRAEMDRRRAHPRPRRAAGRYRLARARHDDRVFQSRA